MNVASSYAAKHAAIASVTSVASSVAAEHASIAAAAKPIGISLFGLHGPVSRVGEGYAFGSSSCLNTAPLAAASSSRLGVKNERRKRDDGKSWRSRKHRRFDDTKRWLACTHWTRNLEGSLGLGLIPIG